MNSINLPSTCRDYEGELPNAQWKKYEIHRPLMSAGLGSSSVFEVYATVIDNIVYMKPTDRIDQSSEYETLFGFGICSQNYDANKIIYVPSDSNYYKNFN